MSRRGGATSRRRGKRGDEGREERKGREEKG